MAEDDAVDEVQGVTTMAVTSGARAAETLLRASQDQAGRQAHEQRADTEQAQQRYEAQARSAKTFYRQASEANFVREQPQDVVVKAWHGAQEWKDQDPDRFGTHADNITEAIHAEYGVDLQEAADRLGDRGLAADLGEMMIQQRRVVNEDGTDLGGETSPDVPGVGDGLEWDSAAARRARNEQLNRSGMSDEVRHAVRVVEHQRGTDPAMAACAGGGTATAASRGRGRGRRRGRGRDR